MTDKLSIDGGLPLIATAFVPRQPISMPSFIDVQTRIQQIKTQATQPANSTVAPTVVRRLLTTGQYQYRVQFMRDPRNPYYQGSSVFIKTSTGTQLVQASGGNGPLIYTTPKQTTPAAVMVQIDNTNASSSTDFGTGNSRALVIT